jgi:hypothetical protein
MVKGDVSDAPLPVDEIVSVEVVTEVSVVGKTGFGPVAAVAAGLVTLGSGVGSGAVATTDSSVVGKRGAGLGVGLGEVAALLATFSGAGAGEVGTPLLIFASVSCCAFTCCCRAWTV